MVTRQPQSDAAAIRASRADPPVFAEVFDRHWPAIHRFCVSRAGHAGEDVAAETFRVAFDGRRRYDGRPNAAPWLYGIATNLLRHWFRGAERAARATARLDLEVGFDAVPETLDRLEAEQLGPELAAALQALSAGDRDALLLHAWASLTYEEIGRALDVPVGTVRSRLHRARTSVRAHIEPMEVHR